MPGKKLMLSYLKVMRPSAALKNVVFFVPAFFSRKLFDTEHLVNLLLVSIGFYLISASIYILNDINDVAYDKNHPIKKHRPVASGHISEMSCFILIMISIFAGVILQNLVAELHIVLIYTASYFCLNLLYVYVLKNFKYVDVTCIAIGFLIRISYGDFIVVAESSDYLFICLFLISLTLGFLKRYGDLQIAEYETETSFRSVQYSKLELQDIIKYLITLLVVVFILYLNRSDTIAALQGTYMLPGSILPILAGLYFVGTFKNNSNTFDPIRFLISDKVLLIIVLMFCIWYVNAIYF